MLTAKKLFLFDIDGTIAVGNELFDGSKELIDYIDSIGGKTYYITNNSTKSGTDYVNKFQKYFHLDSTEDQFITSGYMAIHFLKEHFSGQKIFVLGTTSFVKELKKNGLLITETVEDDIACVIVAYDSELQYKKLEYVCEILSTTDVPYYATNPDLCCPIDFGFIPDCGAICKMIEYSTKKQPVYLGKPSKDVVEVCLLASGFSKEETIVIGDRLYTDIACGNNANVDTCVVYTGEATPTDVAVATPIDTPTYQFNTIHDFLKAVQNK